MKRFLLGLSSLIFLSLTTASLHAETLKIGMMHFPPFYYVQPDRPLGGVFYHLVTKTAQEAGIAFDIKGYPTKRLYTNIAKGETDLFLGTKGPKEFEGKVIFSKTSVASVTMRAFYIGDKPAINSPKDLPGKHMILIRGYGYGGIAQTIEDNKDKWKMKVEVAGSHTAAFKMLQSGRGDYVLSYKLPGDEELKKLPPITGLKHSDMIQIKGYFILNKDFPNAQATMDKLEEAYLKLKNAGKIEATDLLKL